MKRGFSGVGVVVVAVLPWFAMACDLLKKKEEAPAVDAAAAPVVVVPTETAAPTAPPALPTAAPAPTPVQPVRAQVKKLPDGGTVLVNDAGAIVAVLTDAGVVATTNTNDAGKAAPAPTGVFIPIPTALPSGITIPPLPSNFPGIPIPSGFPVPAPAPSGK